jgi:hypothetical protein
METKTVEIDKEAEIAADNILILINQCIMDVHKRHNRLEWVRKAQAAHHEEQKFRENRKPISEDDIKKLQEELGKM